MARKPKDQSQDSTSVGLLEIKLGACLTAPTRRMYADLHSIALECNRVRNGLLRAWQRWREDHDWQPDGIISKKTGDPLTWRGRPMPKNELLPKTESKLLYYAGKAVSPLVSAKIVSGCLQEVTAYLTGNMPYDHRGFARYRWQAIQSHEVSPPSFRSFLVPAQAQDIVFVYDGYACSGSPLSDSQKDALGTFKGAAVLRFALFSKEAGREKGYHVARIEVGQISDGNKNVLRRIARGEWKLCDSKLVFKEGRRPGSGHWSFQLVYRQPVKALGLDASRVAVLTTHDNKAAQPFLLTTEAIPGPRPWSLGRLATLVQQYKRLDLRRRVLRSDYRVAGTGVKGHGNRRFYRDLRKPTRTVRNLMGLFVEGVVSEVLKFCIRFNCGTVRYHEPSMYARGKSWFDGQGIPFNWTDLRAKLTYKLKLHGIGLVEPEQESKAV